MRPITLTFSGLRSYRATTTIDFANLDLFAVIGDTGAGKSTIIEALCLALYAKKSWAGGAKLEQLISDGEKLMRIELTFAAAGETWVVTRARSRSGAGGVDKLVSPSGGLGADGSAPVTERVTEIIGLNYDQFTRAVVLPQGRFDSMLQAGEKERNAILTSILDLEDVVATRTQAEKLKAQWAPKLSAWVADRGHYPVDPAAALTEVTNQAATAVARAEALSAVVKEADALAAANAALDAARPRLLGALDAEAEARVDGDVTDGLRRLHTQWVELATAGATAARSVTETTDALEALDQKTTETLAGFAGRDALVTTRHTIDGAVDALPALLKRRDARRSAVVELEAAPPSAEVAPELVARAIETKEAARKARESVAEAERAVDEARRLWTTLESSLRRVAETKAAVAQQQTVVEQSGRDADAAEKKVAGAEKAVATARGRLADALVADAVATASAACVPGDGCPICTRPLPDSFVPAPPSADRAASEQAVTKAETKLREQQSAAQQAGSARSGHASDLARLVADQAEAETAGEEARGAAGEAAVDVEAETVEVAVAALVTTRDTMTKTATQADQEAETASTAVARGQATAEAAVTAHATALAAARDGLATDDAAVAALAAVVDRLPPAWTDPDASLANRVAQAADALRGAVEVLDTIGGDRARRSMEFETARTRVADVSTKIRDEVHDPMVETLRRVNRQVAAAGGIGQATEQSASAVVIAAKPTATLEDVPDAATPAELAACIQTVSRTIDNVAEVRAAGEQALASVDARTEEISTAVIALLAGVGCATVDQLRVEVGTAQEQQRSSATRLQEAQSAATRAAALDEILAVARPFAANLEVLAVALRDQYFIAHLVDAREAELLAEASRRLKAITKGRFGFVSDFGVVSIASGEVRSADTLSGGERFQAALALALALVEIASRGGGRLDAVFIDEGFGSLDSNALDVALDTLGLVSGDGKMVALISHLRPVAEYVDTVLHVTKDDTLGSRIELLDAESRDQMLADDTKSGLTT